MIFDRTMIGIGLILYSLIFIRGVSIYTDQDPVSFILGTILVWAVFMGIVLGIKLIFS